jgi:hypothetical protein
MSLEPVAQLHLRWLPPAEGGRAAPPSGPVYAATARFAETSPVDMFSIVLRGTRAGSLGEGEVEDVELSLLAADLLPEVAAQLVAGKELWISEGARIVARATLVSVRQQELRRPQECHPWLTRTNVP